MPCVIWINNVAATATHDTVRGGRTTRSGQRITVPNKTICRAKFYISKTGNPTGFANARIRRVSDDSIIETSPDTFNVATAPPHPAKVWASFDFNSLVNEEVRIMFEWAGGSSGNHINMSLTEPAIIGVYTRLRGVYTDYANYDCKIRIYEWIEPPPPTKKLMLGDGLTYVCC